MIYAESRVDIDILAISLLEVQKLRLGYTVRLEDGKYEDLTFQKNGTPTLFVSVIPPWITIERLSQENLTDVHRRATPTHTPL